MRLDEAVQDYLAKQNAQEAPAGDAGEADPAAGEGDAAPDESETESEADGAEEADTEGEEDTDAPEGDEESDEADSEDEEGAETDETGAAPEEEVEPAPNFLAQHADEWAKAPKAVREAILARESQVDHKIASEVGRKTAEIKREAERAAQAKEAELTDRVKRLDDLLPQLVQRAAGKYAGVDWQKLASDDPDQYIRLKAEYDADKEAYDKASAEQQKAREEESARQAKAAREQRDADYAAFIERHPEYQGETGSAKLRQDAAKVETFARSLGFGEEQIKAMSGIEFEVLHDAMNYRNVKKAAASPAPRKPAPAPKTTKPAARKPAGDVVNKKRLTEAEKAFNNARAKGGKMAQIAAAARLYEARKGA